MSTYIHSLGKFCNVQCSIRRVESVQARQQNVLNRSTMGFHIIISSLVVGVAAIGNNNTTNTINLNELAELANQIGWHVVEVIVKSLTEGMERLRSVNNCLKCAIHSSRSGCSEPNTFEVIFLIGIVSAVETYTERRHRQTSTTR